jgi:hypothetical protein
MYVETLEDGDGLLAAVPGRMVGRSYGLWLAESLAPAAGRRRPAIRRPGSLRALCSLWALGPLRALGSRLVLRGLQTLSLPWPLRREPAGGSGVGGG